MFSVISGEILPTDVQNVPDFPIIRCGHLLTFQVIEPKFVTSVLVLEREKQNIATEIYQGEHVKFGEYRRFNVYL